MVEREKRYFVSVGDVLGHCSTKCHELAHYVRHRYAERHTYLACKTSGNPDMMFVA